jgi:hypothetical protein
MAKSLANPRQVSIRSRLHPERDFTVHLSSSRHRPGRQEGTGLLLWSGDGELSWVPPTFWRKIVRRPEIIVDGT